MATRKKAKGKTKAKRKKVTKATRSRATKARKKPAKKTLGLRRAPKKAAPTVAAKARAKLTPSPQPAPPGQRIGVVTHYFGHLSVATLQLEPGTTLRIGDVIHIRGHTTDLNQKVESLEVNHAPITQAGPNDDFGLKVVGHVREHDVVYKV
jgi:putative protease